ncbi:MAG TPA: DNA polymerase III subunit gamma and tau [Streptosporangiaceae bacterium]|nr:DNA polymerase III subunit gamma and tau [Streptosporangiaceae bacterium]
MTADASSSEHGSERGKGHSSEHIRVAAPLALYRRYRPATFSELKGQDHVTEPLRQALKSGRVNHAYLFSGPRGCGKTSSARILARSLNCDLGPTPDPCGECASCAALAPSGPGSIDVIEIDAASHGGIDDARDLRERAFYSPVSARYKIYIIDEAHMVTGAGFNALLKLVEEPPPHLKFVFATTEPEKVIPTIRSRTHHYPFRLVPPTVLRELLEEILAAEKIAFEPSVLPVVIRAGAGSVRDSLSVLDQLIAGADDDGLRYESAIALLGYTDDALLDETAEAFAAGDGALVFRAIDHVVEAGHDPRRFALDLLDRLRDLIVLAAVPDASAADLLDVPEDRLDRMRQQAKNFGQERLVRAAETVSNGLVEMRGATSPRLLLELMCAQVLLPASAQQPSGPATATAGADGLDARVQRLERELSAAMDRLTAISTRTDENRPAVARPPDRSQPRPTPAPQEARVRPQETQSRPAESAHRPERSQSAALDISTVRDRWSDVLDAIREVRKVAWILLNSATVESVEGNVMTLAFAREGDAKGFGSSGCDQDLADVLDRMFGVRPIIRPVAASTQGRGAANDASQPRRDRPRAEAGRADTPGHDDGPVAGSAKPASAPAEETGRGAASSRPAPARSSKPAADPPADKATPTRTRSSASKARGKAPQQDPTMHDDPRPLTDPDQPGPADDLTGTDLVMRELGGKVIEETGDE